MSKTDLMHRVSFKHLSKLLNSPNIIEVGPTMLFESKEELDKAYPMFEGFVNELNNVLANEFKTDGRLHIAKVESDYGYETEISYRTDEWDYTPTNMDDIICKLVKSVLESLLIELRKQSTTKTLCFELYSKGYTYSFGNSYKDRKDISYLGVTRYRKYEFSEPLVNDKDEILSYYYLGLSVDEQDVKIDFSK